MSLQQCVFTANSNTQHYDLVRHSETKKYIKTSEPLNSINMVQLPIWFTPAVVAVEQKCHAALSLISIDKFFCLKTVALLSGKTISILGYFLRFFEKIQLYCTKNVILSI